MQTMFEFYLEHPEATKKEFAFYDSIMAAYEEGFPTKAVCDRVHCSGTTARRCKQYLSKLLHGENLSKQDIARSQITAAWATTRAYEKIRHKAAKLEPCPFCGNTFPYLIRESADGQFQVICDYNNGGCGVSSGYHGSIKETISAWNRRTGRRREHESL